MQKLARKRSQQYRNPKVQSTHMSAMQGKRGPLTQRSAVWTERGPRSQHRGAGSRLRRRHAQAAPSRRPGEERRRLRQGGAALVLGVEQP